MDFLSEREGCYDIVWDDTHGSAAIRIHAITAKVDLDAFYSAVGEVVDRSRARHGHALLMFELTLDAVQMPGLVDNFMTGGPKLLTDRDRLALVVASSLRKQEIKQGGRLWDNSQSFLSRNAALTWLHAHVQS